MKIVFMAPFGVRPKGTLQARMLPLAKALQVRGHEVEIVAPPYTNPEDAGLVEVVEGIPVRNVTLGPAIGVLAAPLIALRMLRTSWDRHADLIHLFKPKGYGGLAALAHLALQACGLRLPTLVVDSDDREGAGGMNDIHPYSWAEKRLFALQETLLTRYAAGVTVASRTLESLAWSMGATVRQTLYLPNGPLVRSAGDRLSGRQRFGIPQDAPVLLLYTRFFEFSQQRLHDVLEQVCRQVPRLRVLVVGQGRHDEERALEQAAIRGGFRDALVLAGWQDPERLPDCLAAADVAIYLFDDTLVNRTKCPAKLAELAAAGIPVVAERVGQIGEYLIHAESGLLAEAGDVAGLVAAVVQVLGDQELACRLGRAAAQRLRFEFGWDAAALRLERFYNGVCRP